MKSLSRTRWSTCRCGAALFFPNTQCVSCGAEVGFAPWLDRVVPLEPSAEAGRWIVPGERGRVLSCRHRTDALACNWLLPPDAPTDLCAACALTRTIPDLSQPGAVAKWAMAELAKRRVLAGLARLGVRPRPLSETEDGVAFDFLVPQPGGPPIMTGHADGVITLNLDEADPAARETVRQQMDESYRTLEGHFRHELAHYFWVRLARDAGWLADFTAVFGDASADYGAALARHHAAGAPADWDAQFVSAYASAHPWEDWAETSAHFLHAAEGLHTARALGLSLTELRLEVERFPRTTLPADVPATEAAAFLGTVDDWVRLALLVNELNRALGMPDAYPFVISASVVGKLWFVQRSFAALARPPAA